VNVSDLTTPAAEPVTVEEVYSHLRLDPVEGYHPHEDMLEGMITSAREDAERITGRCFVQRRVRQTLPDFYSGLCLYRAPYAGGMEILYYDADNALQTLAEDQYLVIEDTFVPRVMLSAIGSWPSTYYRPDAVRFEFDCGYPAADGSPTTGWASNVPASIKDAIKIKVQLLYDELAVDKREALERLYMSLLANHRIYRT